MGERIALVITVLIILLLGSTPVVAQEYIRDEEPIPESVDQVVTPIELSFQEERQPPRFFPWLKEKLKDTDPFLRYTKLDLNIRSYYFYRANYDNSVNEAWALEGVLSYKSGWFLNHFGVGAVLYTSWLLYAPADRDGTGLLKPGQQGYTMGGQIFGRVKFLGDNFINLYRYEYNTPSLLSRLDRISVEPG